MVAIDIAVEGFGFAKDKHAAVIAHQDLTDFVVGCAAHLPVPDGVEGLGIAHGCDQ